MHTPSVLVVDDEVLVRRFMRDVLEEFGFSVHEAADAEGALQKLGSQRFDAIVSDIEIPGGKSGLDLAWIVDARWPSLAIILVSGRDLPSPKGMPLKARFLAKPWDVESFVTTLREAISDAESHRDMVAPRG